MAKARSSITFRTALNTRSVALNRVLLKFFWITRIQLFPLTYNLAVHETAPFALREHEFNRLQPCARLKNNGSTTCAKLKNNSPFQACAIITCRYGSQATAPATSQGHRAPFAEPQQPTSQQRRTQVARSIHEGKFSQGKRGVEKSNGANAKNRTAALGNRGRNRPPNQPPRKIHPPALAPYRTARPGRRASDPIRDKSRPPG